MSLVRDALRRYRTQRKRGRVPTFDEWIGIEKKHPARRFRSGMDHMPITYKKGGRPKDTPARRAAYLEQQRQEYRKAVALDIQYRQGLVRHG